VENLKIQLNLARNCEDIQDMYLDINKTIQAIENFEKEKK